MAANIIDPITEGLKAGWQHIDASKLENDQHFEADVVIVGTGAGGGTAAEILTQAGLKVIMVEAGPLKSSSDFNMEERRAYPDLYQQAAAMKTADKGIGIFQGRSVGGSTTVNWTTSIRTPEQALAFWAQEKSVKGLSSESLLPWFEKMETRLNISEWQFQPNRNNAALKEGCEKLGWEYTVIKRNVKGCWNTGYCGMGCPVNAKQSMLVTTIPSALEQGAQLISNAKITDLQHKADKVTGLTARAPLASGHGATLTFKAKHYILSAGALHTPTILMRANTPDPYQLLGKTFLHPTLLSGSIFDKQIDGHSGAPQSIYSDEFVWRDGAAGELGYKLEVPPIHPVLIASKTIGYGRSHAELMTQFNNLQVMIALVRDGYSAQSPGGQVRLTDTGFALDYPLQKPFWDAARRAFATMAELQFAAGANAVLPINDGVGKQLNWQQAKQTIATMDIGLLKTIVASAHVMGGCAMGEDKTLSMVNSEGSSHYFENLSVMDGSMFPTSLGANPQLSIYAIVARNATLLAERLKPSVKV
ncbi:GMC family oxidoreductase N-terminal domain-containing protein [Pseudomonadota bacterium]|uniref:GMC family oxidoreductase n=1 Tax=unclassified Shewanella TaxID=196818 RepID=UPI000C863F9D|nr:MULTISPECIES: GMC family oxidoreductase [unclassified Shewanella]MDO6640978.1 GMC family oxidoreductase [Shewanella sp. 5_MG-2023]MDO6679196.1 GMC family oxidoreductase [Shewanella sp. 4_MG-2023]MDO6776497.1 GMC family oxidoreductase [Shewanella sp. 3_MG-2023]PMH85360.1 GMC family oxidoreductase [Shewanella sp. 10N.286.48.B5]PMH97033.1 GMC family oxidoreductase [Shewanella sp. 10N.286.48.A6]